MRTIKDFWTVKLKLWNVKLEEFAKASSYAIHR